MGFTPALLKLYEELGKHWHWSFKVFSVGVATLATSVEKLLKIFKAIKLSAQCII